MAAFNQVVIDNVNGIVMVRGSLHTEDDSAVFEALQKFTPDEAEHFGEALLAGAKTAREGLAKTAKAIAGKKQAKKTTKRAKARASKKANRR